MYHRPPMYYVHTYRLHSLPKKGSRSRRRRVIRDQGSVLRQNSNPSPLSSQPTISNPHTLNLVALLAHEIWPITFLSLVEARQLRIIAEFYSALKDDQESHRETEKHDSVEGHAALEEKSTQRTRMWMLHLTTIYLSSAGCLISSNRGCRG